MEKAGRILAASRDPSGLSIALGLQQGQLSLGRTDEDNENRQLILDLELHHAVNEVVDDQVSVIHVQDCDQMNCF